MITTTHTHLMGYRLLIDEGVILKPRWWQILRLLGLRKRELHYTTPQGSVILSKVNMFMTVRREDFNALISDPDDFVSLDGRVG